MDKKQDLRYDADLRGQDFIDNNATALAAIDEMPPLLLMFANLIIKLKAARGVQAVDNTAFAPTKESLKILMGAIVYKYILRGSVKAHLIGNIELECGLDKPITYITSATDDLASDRATELKVLLHTNLSVLPNITAANITEMESAISSFLAKNPLPKEKIKDKHDFGTELIPGLLDEIDVVRNLITKLIHSYLAPALASNWDDYIEVGKPTGVRHLSILAQFKDANVNAILKNVKVTFTNGSETFIKYSSDLGWVRCYSLHTGNWSFIAEFPNYTTNITTNILVDPNKIAHYDIKLHKIVPPSNENPPLPPT